MLFPAVVWSCTCVLDDSEGAGILRAENVKVELGNWDMRWRLLSVPLALMRLLLLSVRPTAYDAECPYTRYRFEALVFLIGPGPGLASYPYCPLFNVKVGF
jgi:hypothetical protein